MLGVYTRWFNDWALLRRLGDRHGRRRRDVRRRQPTPNYPLAIAGFTLPGYTAIYTVILNLAVAVVLTPIFNAMRGGKPPLDATVAADYLA